MTTPGGGGDRLEVSVVADATGFAKDAQAKIDAATERIRAKIKVDIEYARLQAQAEAAAKRISKQTEIRLQLGVDKKFLFAQLDAAVAEANARNYAVKIKVEVDKSQLDEALANGGGTVNVSRSVLPTPSSGVDVPIHTDDKTVLPEVEAVIARAQAVADSNPIDVPVQINQESAKRSGRGIRAITGLMSPLQKVGFYAGLVQTLASAAVAAGGGLLAMAGAASQAVGVLGALPNLVGVAVQGIGALFAGFSGVTKAVGLMGKVQAASGRSASQSAQQQAAAAKAITAAERGVTDAQKASVRAQEALSQARKDAQRQLRDYQLQLSGAALDEEDATNRIEEARLAWNKAMRNPSSTALDRKEADLALRQAEQSLKEIQQRNSDLREEASAADAAGVEGSVQVVSAKDDVANALQGELDAQQNLADAIQSASDQMAAQSAQASQLAAAMDQLSPAGQAFARFLNDVAKPRMIAFRNAIQQELLPGVQSALTALMTDPDPGKGLGSYLDVLQDGLKDSGKIMGDTAKQAGIMMSTPGFRADTATIMESNNRALKLFSGAGLDLVDVLRNLAVAAGPLLERFAGWVGLLAGQLKVSTEAGRETGKLGDFLQRAGDRAAQLGHIVGNLMRTLFQMGKAGTETGDNLLDKFERLTTKWNNWANSDAGQKRMRDFFEKIQPLFEAMGSTIAKVTQLITQMGENGGGSVAGMLETINLLLDALNWLVASPIGPFISVLMQFGGVASVVGLAGGKVIGLVSSISSGVKAAADFATGMAGGVQAASALGTGAAEAGAKVAGLYGKVADLASSGWNKIKGGASAVAELGTNAAEAGKKAVVAAAKWAAHAAAVTATTIARGAMAVATGILTAAEWLLNAAMAANPIMWIVLAIGLLVAAFIWAWNNIDGFKQFFVGAFDAIKKAVGTAIDWVKNNWPLLLAILTGPIGLAVKFIVDHWDQIVDGARKAFGWLGGIAKDAMNAVVRALNGTVIAGINLVIRGLNKVNPFSDIPQVPKIPQLAQGAIVNKPTLAMIGEDGSEAVIPLSAGKAKRRQQLMDQAGLSAPPGGSARGDASGIGGWARLDSLNGSSSLAELVATSGGAIDRAAPGGNVGTLIQEGAVKQYITNPAPETASGTLNSGLRRVAATGIFGSGPAS